MTWYAKVKNDAFKDLSLSILTWVKRLIASSHQLDIYKSKTMLLKNNASWPLNLRHKVNCLESLTWYSRVRNDGSTSLRLNQMTWDNYIIDWSQKNVCLKAFQIINLKHIDFDLRQIYLKLINSKSNTF